MALRNTIFADIFYRILERTPLTKADHPFLQPNLLTLSGLILAFIVPFGFYFHPMWGFFFIVLSGCTDAADGLVAKKQGKNSILGAFLDSTFDRVSDFLYLFGFWILFWDVEPFLMATALIFMSSMASFMISYTKARAEGLGLTCETGFMDRGMRVVFLSGWALGLALFPGVTVAILWAGLISFSLLTLFTVIQRIRYIHARQKPSE